MHSGVKPTTAIRSMLRTSLDTRILLCLSTIMTGQHPIEANRYFCDLYGVYQNADAATTAGGIKKAPAQVSPVRPPALSAPAQAVKYSLTRHLRRFKTHTSRGHANYNECNKRHYVQNLGHIRPKDTATAVWFRHLPGLRQSYMDAPLPTGRNLHQQRLPFVFVCLRSDQKVKPSMRAAIVIATALGRNIPAVSTGAKPIAGTAAHPAYDYASTV